MDQSRHRTLIIFLISLLVLVIVSVLGALFWANTVSETGVLIPEDGMIQNEDIPPSDISKEKQQEIEKKLESLQKESSLQNKDGTQEGDSQPRQEDIESALKNLQEKQEGVSSESDEDIEQALKDLQ